MRHVAWKPVVLLGCGLGLGGCVVAPPGYYNGYYNPPMTVQSEGTVPYNHPPESANGLPPGAVVVAPFTSPVGDLRSTRVGPPVAPYYWY